MVSKHRSTWIRLIFVLGYLKCTMKSRIYSLDTSCTTKIKDPWLCSLTMSQKHSSNPWTLINPHDFCLGSLQMNHAIMGTACITKIMDPRLHSHTMAQKHVSKAWILRVLHCNAQNVLSSHKTSIRKFLDL